MSVSVLYPRLEYSSIGARVASWETQSRLRRAETVAEVVYYEESSKAADVVAEASESFVLVVIDPLVTTGADLAVRLCAELEQSRAAVVIPAGAEKEPPLYLCTSAMLRAEVRPLRQALEGRAILIAQSISVGTRRCEPISSLLPFVPANARSILHVECGDGTLGEQIKQRQRCRVLGIESDRELVSKAKRRIDDVYSGDVDEIVSILRPEFDCIITNDALAHRVDPWSLLADLRRITLQAGILVAALPNVAQTRVIAALRKGHFDVGAQLRFFTRESIEDLMDIAGWEVDTIEPLAAYPFGADTQDDLNVTWFAVVARCQG